MPAHRKILVGTNQASTLWKALETSEEGAHTKNCKSMAASNFWDDRRPSLIPVGYFNSWGQSVFSKGKLKIMGKGF